MLTRFCLASLAIILTMGHPALAAYDSAAMPKTGPLEIIRITPEGENVPAAKQLVIQFNRAVVPIGKMERAASEIPVIIAPALNCEWRWINTSALACNLPDQAPLQPATQYKLEVKPGILAEDGATIAETYHHQFTTERPRVSYKEFHFWKSAGYPVVRLVFNQPVDKISVADHIVMAVGDNGEGTVHVKVRPDPEDRTPPEFMPIPGEKKAMRFAPQKAQHSDEQTIRKSGREARRIWLVEPKHELPLDANVVIKAEAGLQSALGDTPGLADDSIVQFNTYPAFRFLGTNCSSNDGNTISIPAGEKVEAKCNPLAPINLVFSAPVERKEVARAVSFSPAVGGWSSDTEDNAEDDAFDSQSSESRAGSEYRRSHQKSRAYTISLPASLKAAQEYHGGSRAKTLNWFERMWHGLKSLVHKTAPINVHDIFGRTLENTLDVDFVTDHRSPNYVLDYNDAVLEKNVDSEVPFYVNNLENYRFDYRKLTTKGLEEDKVFKQAVPAVQDIQFAVPLGVRDMLGGASGAIYGYLYTTPVVTPHPPSLFAQVTPYQVHLKLGHFTSIAWVVDMATGAPVAGAKVGLFVDSFPTLGKEKKPSATAITDANGIAALPGTETLDPDLTLTREYNEDKSRYFVRVEKGDNLAILPVLHRFEINSYRASGSESVYPSNKSRYGHMKAWGTTAQGIYRAGDVIQYKLFVRNQDNNHLVPPPTSGYTLKIIDPMGKVVHTVKNVKLSAFGGYDGTFAVPKEGAVGWYEFKLIVDFAKRGDTDDGEEGVEENEAGADGRESDNNDDGDSKKYWIPLRVMVSDFTPAAFKTSNQLSGDLFRAGEKVQVTTRAELHSGGAYTDANARVTAILDSRRFTSKHPLAKDFEFDSYVEEASSQQLFQKMDAVNDKGELALSFDTGKPGIVYGKLTVESAVADDRGKYIAGQSTADYMGVDRLVGLHSKQWVFEAGKPASIDAIVVDEKGSPIAGTNVDVAVEYQSTKAARVKGEGNAYLSEYHTEWVPAGSCKITSSTEPMPCSFTPEKAGSYRAIAKIKDTKGRDHTTTLSTYVTGRDFVIWNDENDTSLTIIPQTTDYKVGDKARFLVKNPYPGAKALITVERYGVIDRFMQTFDSSTPVVEFPIKPDYLPGFYLSVVVISPRVEKPLGEGQVDLGKPTFRMGYMGIPVRDPYKEITITSTTDKPVYKPREKVTVKLHAEPRVQGKKEPIELTVAVLDESVFDLVTGGKANFDPYAGFYKLESLDLRNYSLLTRLIGRQRFEKKGANPGGDGGADLSMRSLFKFVSYWNGALKTDANGDATVSFEAPDNLTGWRILALASTPTDRFGLGDANFKVNRPTEVRPVMPNQVSEGDRFDAGFSVMNRTDKPREVTVHITAEGNFDAAKTPAMLTKKISLAPYKRETVRMPIQTTSLAQKREVAEGAVKFTVTAGDASDEDGMLHSVPVRKIRTLEVAANYGTTTSDKVEESIAFPKEMLPDVGSFSVVASPTVIGNITGAFAYMRDYPYLCWEQRLSKAVMASHYKNLRAYLPNNLPWDGSDKLPQETLDGAASFQAPNGGMTYFVAQDQYVDPYLSAYTALAFNWLKDSGYKAPEEVESKLQTYLNTLLKNDAMPDFYSEGMSSTVRAVALAALAKNGKVALSDLERYAPHVGKMSLFGKTHFLQAAMLVKGGEKFADDTAKAILATANQTGGKFVFSETLDDSYSRILSSPLRENCAILDTFTAYGERAEGKSLVSDVPFKLVRFITQSRGQHDYWENTQENLFCMNALVDFAKIYEKDKPVMKVTASLNGAAMGSASFATVRDPASVLEHPNSAADVGKKATLTIERNGTGRLYYASRLAYALPAALTKSANAGIEIHREYSVERDKKWVLLTSPSEIKRGELVRVDLYVSLPAARNFVVVDDAVPGGLEPINRDLATSSKVDADKAVFNAAGGSFWFKFSDWSEFAVSRWNFYHQEIRHDSVRFYADYLPAGNYHLSYAAQVIATGNFSARPAKVSEMYDTDVYGLTDGLQLNVGESLAPVATKKP